MTGGKNGGEVIDLEGSDMEDRDDGETWEGIGEGERT